MKPKHADNDRLESVNRTPRAILVLLGLISLFVVISGAAGIWQSFESQAWFRVGFEGSLTFVGIFGLLTALGRFQSAAVWSMTTVGGVVTVASMLAFFTRGGAPSTIGLAIFRDMIHDPHAAARLLAGISMLILASLTLLLRGRTLAFRRLFKGLAFLAPVALVALLWFAGPLARLFDGLNVIVQSALVFFGFFIFLFLISAGVHFVIRALEAGVSDGNSSAKTG